jgi:hypothetical protein
MRLSGRRRLVVAVAVSAPQPITAMRTGTTVELVAVADRVP